MEFFFDVILKNGTIASHLDEFRADLGIKGGKIAYIGSLQGESAQKIIDCRGLHILPGVIDSQVHFRDPGFTHKEDLQSGSLAAIYGGVTTIFEMPNTNPATVTKEALQDKVNRASDSMYCDFAFWIGATAQNAEYIDELECLPGCAGIKVFVGSSTGDLLLEDQATLRRILQKARRRVAFHSEQEQRLRERKSLREYGNAASHYIWRDEIAAYSSTEALVRLAYEAKAAIHILHVSTAQEIAFLQNFKARVSCEVTPHHLTLTAQDYAELGSLIQMNPPIREALHKEALWQALQQGGIDVIGSDHAPHSLEEKAKIYPDSPSGMPGVQTTLPLMLNYVNEGKLSLARLVELTSYGPHNNFNIAAKGRMALGYDADFALVDLKAEQILLNEDMKTKVRWTPYHNKKIKGVVKGTMLRGELILWEGALQSPPRGQRVEFIYS